MKKQCPTTFALDQKALVGQIQQISARGLVNDAELGLVLSDVVLRVQMPQGVSDYIKLTVVEHRSQLKSAFELTTLGNLLIQVSV